MISHIFPTWDSPLGCLAVCVGPPQFVRECPKCVFGRLQQARSAGYGPFRVEFHIAGRLQRTGLDSWLVPLGARPRRFRWSLLLAGDGSPGDRGRRKPTDGRDRGFDKAFCTVFGSARTVRSRTVRDKRNAEDRRRGARSSEQEPQATCGNYRDGGICWSRQQVPDLGARPFPKRAREGHRRGASQQRAEFPGSAARRARSTGMTAGGDGSAVAGGPALHIPVLGRAAVEFLQPRRGGVYIDSTCGAGGYTRVILAAADCKVIGIDRDQTAIALGADLVEQFQGRLTLIEDRFSNLEAVAREAGFDAVDGVVLDLGVSSMQLDSADRGFSFRFDGPLHMRMSGAGAYAADLVNSASEHDLADIIFTWGEERHSRAVARAIVKARQEAPLATTRALAETVGSVVRSRPNEIHPATRTFQALRIYVNDELGELAAALQAAERIIKAGGRLVAVSFHSLEDRIVKVFLADRAQTRAGSRHAPEVTRAAPTFRTLTKRPIVADEDEIARNPRARSAKLRAAERTEGAARAGLPSGLVPSLPSVADVLRGR